MKLSARLNQETRDVEACAWPGCTDRLFRDSVDRDGRHFAGRRIGVLCMDHARQVAEACIEQNIWAEATREWLREAPAEPVDFRGVERLRREKQEDLIAQKMRGDNLGFVYYLQVGERIKVGFSTDVKKRMKQYPPGSVLLAVEPGDYDLELRRHRQFAGSRTDGREWFRPTTDLLEHAAAMVAQYGDPKRFAHHYRKNQQPVRITRSA